MIAALLPAAALAQTGGVEVQRYAGSSRADTASAVALDDSLTGALFDRQRVILVRQDDFADGLAASYLSGILDAPILLSGQDEFPSATQEALETLGPRTVVVVGGQAAIADEALEELPAETEVIRVAGRSRFDTAAEVARFTGDTDRHTPDTVLVASGRQFADALVAAPLAAAAGIPLILTEPDALPGDSADVIEDLRADRAIVVGGTAVVSAAVADDLAALGLAVERVAGADRYETSRLVAEQLVGERFGWQLGHVVLATGTGFADALSAGAFAANSFSGPAPILLTAPEALPGPVSAYLDGLAPCSIFSIHAVGGPAAISDAVLDEVAGIAERGSGCSSGTAPSPVVTSPTATQRQAPIEAVVEIRGHVDEPTAGIRHVLLEASQDDELYPARLIPEGDGTIGWAAELAFASSGAQTVSVTAVDGLGRERTTVASILVDAPEGDELVLGYDVELIDEEAEQALEDVSEDADLIELDRAGAPDWERGDIIVPTELDGQLPDGARRRVDLVQHRGNRLDVYTTPAVITEVIVNGDLSTTDPEIAQRSGFNQSLDAGFSFGGDFSQAIIPGITASGSAEFGGKVLFDLFIDWGLPPRVEYARGAIEGSQSFNLQVEAGGTVGGSRELFRPVRLGAIRFTVAGVPVWFTPEATGLFYVHGSLTARVGYSQSSNLLLGFEYRDGAARPLNTYTHNERLTGVSGPEINASFEAGVTLAIEFKLYDQFGPKIVGDIFGTLTTNGNTYDAEFGVRLAVTVNVSLEIGWVDVTLLDFRFDLVEYRVPIGSGSTSQPAPNPDPPPDPDPDPPPDPGPDPPPDPDPDPPPDPDPDPPPPAPSVSVSKGGSAQGQPGCSSSACAYVNVSMANFAANTTYSIECWSTVDSTPYFTYQRTTNGSGASSSSVCYFGFPGQTAWVVAGGVRSNNVVW